MRCEVKRALRRELNTAGTMAALACGRVVICVAKVTARALVRDGLMRSAYRGRVGTTPVTVLRPQPAAPAVQPIPAGTTLKWASPGGRIGTLPGGRFVRRRYAIDWYAAPGRRAPARAGGSG